MQFLTFFINFLALFQACVLAVPSSMQRRAANLQISLRQTQPNTSRWHFALVTHAPDPTNGVKPVLEHVIDIDTKCFDFQERDATVKTNQLVVTGTLVAAQGEADDGALTKAVQAIIKKVPPASQTQVLSGSFMNCFAFTVVAINTLASQGYVSPTDAQLFVNFFNANSVAVSAATKAGTMAMCTRDDSDTPCALPGVDSSLFTSVASSTAASFTESTSSSTATPNPDVPPVVPPVPPGVPPAPPVAPPEVTPPVVPPPIVPPAANSSSTVQSTLFSTVETTSTVLPSTLFSTVETTSIVVPSTLFSTVQTTSTVV